MALSNIPPIGLVLSEDSKQLEIKFDSAPHLYTADQVETLIIILMNQRAAMTPSVQPLTSDPVHADRVLVAD